MSLGQFVTFRSVGGGEYVAMMTGVSTNAETGEVAVDLTVFPRGGPPYAVTSILEGTGPGCWSWPGEAKPVKKAKK